MATQQGAPSRPWFRLATMVRPSPDLTPPPPPPPQAPRPTFIRPAFSQSIRPAPPPPPPPQPNGVAPTSSPPTPLPPNEPRNTRLQQSGSPSMVTPPPIATSPMNTARPATPTTSPIINRTSRTPSPLSLPSPQLNSYDKNPPEYEQKTVLVHETKEKPNNHNPKPARPGPPKKPEPSKTHSDSEDFRMRIITIAGENKGAIMDLTPFDKRTRNFGNNTYKLPKNGNRTSSDEEKSGSNSEGNSKAKNKNQKPKSRFMNAIMNSNVQGVNNSILFNSSATHHDPGIHLSRSRKPNGGHRF